MTADSMLKLFNTLTRKKEAFKPAGTVGFYFCGPTVYDYAHIGNFRSYIFADLLRRYLEFLGCDVKFVMNITDVDDKTIKNSQKEGVSLKEFTQRYEKAFFEDIAALRIKPATANPRATEHINEMISLINGLLKKGIAYITEDGVYYNIAKFPAYGKLSKINVAALQSGERVKKDEYTKEQAQDFALWKAWSEEDGDVFWTADFGGTKMKGRPGWHIECSVMSAKQLQMPIDIHGGGVDLIFPHHENEIAQSEPACGRFARYWVHCEHLLVDGQKMSKSLGNFYTLRDVLGKGHDPIALRFLLISAHYRQQLNFTFEALEKSRETVNALNDFAGKLRFLEAKVTAKENKALQKEIAWSEKEFRKHMDDDLNVPMALAAIFEMMNKVNTAIDSNIAGRKSISDALSLMEKINSVFDILSADATTLTKEEQGLIDKREQLRKEKKFGEADRIRDKVKEGGILLEDTPYGPRAKLTRAAPIMIQCPTIENIVEINKKVLQEIKVKKADRSALMPSGRGILESILKEMKEKDGDVFDKCVILLKGIIQKHPFESGNRRTAFVVAASFLEINSERLNITHEINILQGIREDYYTDEEIKNWIKKGEIRGFERFY